MPAGIGDADVALGLVGPEPPSDDPHAASVATARTVAAITAYGAVRVPLMATSSPEPRPIPTPGGYSPVSPSTASRSRSAWPLWRAYSSTMCTSTHRSVTLPLPSQAG